jgi:hypothetical protein
MILAGGTPSAADLSTIASQIARAEFVSQRSLERHLQQRVEEEQWSTCFLEYEACMFPFVG